MEDVWEQAASTLNGQRGAQQAAPQPSQYAKPGPYLTKLSPSDEQQFSSWVKQNKVPFDSSDKSDYDMRGYWLENKGKLAGTEQKSDGLHFPDTYKTPYHKSFSNESKYATADAPRWDSNDRLVDKGGKVLVDESHLKGGSGDVWGQAAQTIKSQPAPAGPGPQKDGFFKSLYDGTVGGVVDLGKDYSRHVSENQKDWGILGGFPAVLQTVSDVGNGINNGVINAGSKTIDAIKNHDYRTAIQQAPGVVPLLGPMAVKAGEQVDKKDYSGALGTALALGLSTPEGAGIVGKGLGKGFTAAKDAIPLIGDAEDAIKNKISDRFSPAEHDPAASILTKSLRGSVPQGRVGFTPNLKRSMPLVKETEEALGKPIETVDDLIGEDGRTGAIGIAKQANRAKFNELMKSKGQMGLQVDGTPIADAMEKSITKKMMLEDPAKVESIKKLSDVYRKKFTVEDLDELLQNHNAELDSYYSKNPSARKAAQSNPDTAMTVAQAEATRKTLYNALDDKGLGEAAQELQRNYGSLSELQEAFQKRKNVALRQAPDSLSEQLSKWDAVKNGLNGFGKVATGKFGDGIVDMGSALGEARAAKWIKDWQSTDGMVKRAFTNYAKKPAEIEMPAPFTPAGLLGAGPAGRTANSVGARFEMPGETPYSQKPVSYQGIDKTLAWRQRNSGQRLLGAGPERVHHMPSPDQTADELVPIVHPVTGKREYIPRWMTERVKVEKP